MDFVSRTFFEWHLRTRKLPVGRRTLIMGILNVTPDSFSDGGSFTKADSALRRATEMLDEGADIVDVGGESTRPSATPLPAREEQNRVLPVVESLLKQRPDAVVSIDTYHAETARLAVASGAEIVNDVSGHLWDPDMANTCADLRCGTVLMHTRGRPAEWKSQPALAPDEIWPLILEGLNTQAAHAISAGVPRENIALDPGFGFGKMRGENYPLMACLPRLRALGFPLLVGLSRKSFLHFPSAQESKQSEGEDTQRRLLSATLAANTAAILAGAHIVRVHDVAEAKAAADVADAIVATAMGN